jgi:DNA repair ATPase RecN
LAQLKAHDAEVARLADDNAVLMERNPKLAEQLIEAIAAADSAQAKITRLTMENEGLRAFKARFSRVRDWLDNADAIVRQAMTSLVSSAGRLAEEIEDADEITALRARLERAEAVARASRGALQGWTIGYDIVGPMCILRDTLAAYDEAADDN